MEGTSVQGTKNQRSLPIPKEVNNFVLKNYGALYYLSTSVNEKIQILQAIEKQLKTAGYNITWSEIERRLKNMKSHYRRKQNEIRMGNIKSVEWEYFEALDSIFGAVNFPMSPRESYDQKFASPENQGVSQNPSGKRKITYVEEPIDNVEVKNEKAEVKPEDLSVKRPKLIEFSHKSELTSQITVTPDITPRPHDEAVAPVVFRKIMETFRALDEQRCSLDQQRLALEVRRHELDSIGFQLSSMLHRLLQAPNNNQSEM